jgi:putative (di)nucleoside polyphosphate hydrolase
MPAVVDEDGAGDRAYRPNVGIALFNRQGWVLVARRAGSEDSWQLPQGGVDSDEDLERAARRELCEEVGTDNAVLLGRLPGWLRYDLPAGMLEGHRWKGKWKGQRQAWFAFRLLGEDSEIDLTHEDPPEFDAWKWVELAEIPALIVPFKRPIYVEVARGFAQYAVPVPKGAGT